MKKSLAYLPNSLTILRLLLLVPFLFILAEQLSHFGHYMPIILYFIMILIYVTDFLDGRLARALKAVSAFGGILDITADGLFIVLSLIIFNIYNILPVWFTVVVILDFLGFLFTSQALKHLKNTYDHLLVFDTIGRAAAVVFYAIPFLTCLTVCNPILSVFLSFVLYINTALAGISMAARCVSCICPLLLNQQKKAGPGKIAEKI